MSACRQGPARLIEARQLPPSDRKAMSKLTQIAIGSLVVGVVVLALKLAAWRITGSVALYSDAIESIVNVVAAGVALYAVQLAQKPATASTPTGTTRPSISRP